MDDRRSFRKEQEPAFDQDRRHGLLRICLEQSTAVVRIDEAPSRAWNGSSAPGPRSLQTIGRLSMKSVVAVDRANGLDAHVSCEGVKQRMKNPPSSSGGLYHKIALPVGLG